MMNWIHLGAVSHLDRRLHDREAVVRDLRPKRNLDLPDAARILQAATINADHAPGYADAFAAATALAHHAPLLTGDPELLLPGASWAHEDLLNR